jgi:hypothetical protein
MVGVFGCVSLPGLVDYAYFGIKTVVEEWL